MKPLGSTELKRLHRGWRRETTGRVGLLLESVQTPFNVGAIVRSAAAWRVDDVWLTGATADPASAKVQKTALGSHRYLRLHHGDDLDAVLGAVDAAGYRLVGVELAGGARPLHELDLAGDVCLAVGHEDRGLSPALLGACPTVGYIPLLGRIGSLNVATAAAVAVYEARRQEWTGRDH